LDFIHFPKFYQNKFMLGLFKKAFSTPETVIPRSELVCRPGVLTVGAKLTVPSGKIFGRSLAIREVDAGSTNTEEEELKALTNAYYDAERFGIHFVASPRHADMLIVTGPVTRNMADAVRRSYDATPEPKIVVAVGDGAIDGGIFKDSYAIVGGVDKIIPVNFYIHGDPPTAKDILAALLEIMSMTDNTAKKK
jgi:Ni,Fe-hydrogenase III small subunit